MNVKPFAVIGAPISPARAPKEMIAKIRERRAGYLLILKWVDMSEAPVEWIPLAPTPESDKCFSRPSHSGEKVAGSGFLSFR